ncbi:MAG: NAD(P)H-dependent oxidoreductase [Okeania sp. SIO3B5]|nr:NAD(P)H-dependent oxidoreductase [Okeania sp. SIO3B5]NEO52491.1 NAD(P)H-dependent oxidoreductase [Okeania sp. SIO3B5]
MKVLIVYWHPEPQSFNGAMFRQACETLLDLGSGGKNFRFA